MKPGRSRFARSQRMTIVNAIVLLIMLVLILQLWLLTATMNAFLGGDGSVPLPAAVASLICLLLNGGLLLYLRGLER